MAKIITDLIKGPWSSIVAYTIGDIVLDLGSSYICIANNTNHEPPNTDYWVLFAQKGNTGNTGSTGPTGPQGSGALVDTDPTLAANLDTNVASQKATKSFVNTQIANIPTDPTDGWISSSDTLTYISANSFKITGADKRTTYTKGTRIKFTNNSVTYYGVVISSAFSTDTTVTLAANTDYAIANSGITNPFYSYQVNPQGYPGWFAYTPTWGGFSSNPTSVTSRFSITGRTCFVEISCGGNGTSNSTLTTVTLPANAATALNIAGFIGYNDNGATASTPGIIILNVNSNIADLRKDLQAATWTASGSKAINLILTYEI